MQTFIPLYDHILVRPDPRANVSPGGIHIPDVAKERPREGLVLEVGEGHVGQDGTVRPLRVQAGERVMYGQFSGQKISLGGEELLILREGECLGRVVDVVKPPQGADEPVSEVPTSSAA